MALGLAGLLQECLLVLMPIADERGLPRASRIAISYIVTVLCPLTASLPLLQGLTSGPSRVNMRG